MSRNIITSFVSEDGVPLTGISPTINIRNASTGSLIITGESMDEIGDGFYGYEFVGYDPNIDYAVRCDSGVSASNRYSFGPSFIDNSSSIQTILDIESGRWKIINNQMIFYKADGVTEIMRFNLYDAEGNLAMDNVFERTRA